MTQDFFIEVNCQQQEHQGERISGDVFLSQRIANENRTIIVLSDGMGHGVKANVLASLTATMALKFTKEHKEIHRIADIIMNTLPVCSVRKMSYSTFTIIDIEHGGETSILEYDNPECLILRGNEKIEPPWQCVILNSEINAGKELRYCTFTPQLEDRIIAWSDGITQSGLGSNEYPFGWGLENATAFAQKVIQNEKNVSARTLSSKLVNMAIRNDNLHPKDDISVAVAYFREPRKLLITTGPPFEQKNDKKMAQDFKNFKGKKIICGATTVDILSRELRAEVIDSLEFTDDELPPISYMDGADLVTEGVLTLNKSIRILKEYDESTRLGRGPADLIVNHILNSDEIHFLVGTKINTAHQDPNLPIELEIRRSVIRRMADVLETKFLKEVHITLM